MKLLSPRLRRFYAYLIEQQLETERGLAQIWFIIQASEVIAQVVRQIGNMIATLAIAIWETLVLVEQFLKASYRGICPFIEFKTNDSKHQVS